VSVHVSNHVTMSMPAHARASKMAKAVANSFYERVLVREELTIRSVT